MCVTNTTHRRVQAVTLAPNQLALGLQGGNALAAASLPTSPACPPRGGSAAAAAASALSQRLFCGGYQFQLPQPSPAPGVLEFPTYPPSADPASSAPARAAPKRRRKPQKPGKTAKMNDRHFVVHNYHDHASDPPAVSSDSSGSSCCGSSVATDPSHAHAHSPDDAGFHDAEPASSAGRRRGGVAVAFPLKLHAVLEQVERDGYAAVVSWSPHGRCFVIHKPKQFVEEVMPKYFRQSKLTSFQRQLNLYGFARLTRGPDAGGYYHELFLRHREHLCSRMVRTKVKGTKFKAASSPDSEPDFYAMPPVSPAAARGGAVGSVTPPLQHEDYDEDDDDDEDVPRGTGILPPAYQQPQAAVPPVPLLYAPAVAGAAQYYGGSMSYDTGAPYGAPSYAASVPRSGSDQILDDAVDELFLNELGDEEDQLTDFVADWMCPVGDSTGYGSPGDAHGLLNDDAQLGFMLERLLED